MSVDAQPVSTADRLRLLAGELESVESSYQTELKVWAANSHEDRNRIEELESHNQALSSQINSTWDRLFQLEDERDNFEFDARRANRRATLFFALMWLFLAELVLVLVIPKFF